MSRGFLYQKLREDASDLANNLDRIWEEALAIWREPRLLSMTQHGRPHLEQVEKNLDQLSQPLYLQGLPLSSAEIYVLLAACYLHDIGMQLDVPDAREQHAQYSYELILYSEDAAGRKLSVKLPIQDDNAREAVAEVARAHWARFAVRLPEKRFLHGNEEGRIRLLGSLLSMADLLDFSPVRARYYRTPHRLQELPGNSDLHQMKHRLIRGFRITSPLPQVPSDLQVQIEWRDNSEQAQMISDWVLHESTNYWRQIQPLLYSSSAGRLRWATPWAQASFFPPQGPLRTLSREARGLLQAYRQEQQRIDRDEFCRAFSKALGEGRRALFLVPNDTGGDGLKLSSWCHTQATTRRDMRVAKLDIRRVDAPDPSGLLAELLEQWGQHLPDVPESKAFDFLRQELMAPGRGGAVTVILAEEYSPRLLDSLIGELFTSPAEEQAPRVCVLFSPGAEGPVDLKGVDIQHPSWSEIS